VKADPADNANAPQQPDRAINGCYRPEPFVLALLQMEPGDRHTRPANRVPETAQSHPKAC
jgi:hypothetical protein